MTAGAWLETDLLRQRREQFGYQRPGIVPVRTLLRRGALIGAVLPATLLLGALVLWLMEWAVAGQIKRLQPDAGDYDRVVRSIAADQKALEALLGTNEAMARRMADVRSSSAVLGELKRLTPSTVQLESTKIEVNTLNIDGYATQPGGLRAVNAFILVLAQSGLFQPDGVVLTKAEAIAAQQDAQAWANPFPRLKFSLRASFAPDAPQAMRDRLTTLGADGLAKRIEMLQREQLIP